jgi:hypothetical protein
LLVTPQARRVKLRVKLHQRTVTGEQVIEFLSHLLKSKPSLLNSGGYMFTAFQLVRPNSIQWNSSGRKSVIT